MAYTISYAGRLSGIEKTDNDVDNYLTFGTLIEAQHKLVVYADQFMNVDRKAAQELKRAIKAIKEKHFD